ncbi:MAG: CPBP family intramembrane metalloprotease [SAR202 cluster bacterium]|nr:CPBP family intramembrane metalloprotease [SAR202 cluster bacterium]
MTAVYEPLPTVASGQAIAAPRVPWRVRDTLAGLALVAVVSVAAAVTVLLSLGSAAALSGGMATTLQLLILQATMLVVALALGPMRYRSGAGSLGFRVPAGEPVAFRVGPVGLTVRWVWLLLWAALGTGIAINMAYSTVVEVLGLERWAPSAAPVVVAEDGVVRVANSIAIGFLGPMAEEVFYRGFMLAAMVKTMGAVRGSLVASAIFALSHLNPLAFVPIFTSGLLLAWLYLRTGSIWPPFFAHAAQNLIVLALTAAEAR